MIVVDAGPLVAIGGERDPLRHRVREVIRAEAGGLFVPAPVTAEVDYLLGRRYGERARRAFIADLAERRLEVPSLSAADHAAARDLDRRYADLELGLADLSIAVVAAKLDTRRLLTFDERRFRAVRPLQGGAFTLLPADAA